MIHPKQLDPTCVSQEATQVAETSIDIARRVCRKTRVFSGGEVELSATAEQFQTLVSELVARHASRLLLALDAMDRGCNTPGFRGHQNGLGEDAGDELQAAREELTAFVGHQQQDWQTPESRGYEHQSTQLDQKT